MFILLTVSMHCSDEPKIGYIRHADVKTPQPTQCNYLIFLSFIATIHGVSSRLCSVYPTLCEYIRNLSSICALLLLKVLLIINMGNQCFNSFTIHDMDF